ncbi:hypothetical protein [Allocoleopsis sp.]|uniref:hypothetical protein n=1 Tax=Allocoleopsis sp. TaxID=3088169 RepID=UPI002FCFD961
MSLHRRLCWGAILVLSTLLSTISLASAELVERNFILNSDSNPSFDNLLQQAQDLASQSIEQEFAENPETSEISIMVLGEHQGQIVPLLRSQVTRTQWQRDSRIYRWTRYFANNSQVLLGFNNPPTVPKATTYLEVPRRIRLEGTPGFRDD